jgi:hypothetical protein
MIDGGVLAGYLAVAATRAAGRVFDKAVDGLFDRLSQRVAQRLGWQAVASINAQPGNVAQHKQVGQGIEAVARLDSQFAAELAELQRKLDQRVGRQVINNVVAHTNIQAFGGGSAYGGHHYELNVPDPTDYSKAPAWVKLLTVVGIVIALVGFGMAFLGILGFIGSVPNASPTDLPDFGNVLPGFGLFFVGLVVLIIANVGKAMSKRR